MSAFDPLRTSARVVRRGDDWRQHLTLREDLSGAERPDPSPLKDDNYPEETVAEAIVLYVRSLPGRS